MNALPQLPADMIFYGPVQGGGGMAAGVRDVSIDASAFKESKSQFLDTMKTNNIDLAKILKSEFQRIALSRGILAFVQGDAMPLGDLSLTVNVYGYLRPHVWSTRLVPFVNVSATLKRPDGEVAWQRTDFVSALNSENTSGYEFEQYVGDPELIRKTLTSVAGIVSNMLLESLEPSR